MANIYLDMFRGGEGQEPVEVDPELNPAGYKYLLAERARNRREQMSQAAGPMAGLQSFGNEAISQQWDPFFEGIQAVREQHPGKRFAVDTRGLNLPADQNISEDPRWWLQGMTQPQLSQIPPSLLPPQLQRQAQQGPYGQFGEGTGGWAGQLQQPQAALKGLRNYPGRGR